MKKSARLKAAKKKSRKRKAGEPELPQLVAVMMKIAERLETLEKKADRIEAMERKIEIVLRQTSARPQEIRHAPQDYQRPVPPHHGQPAGFTGQPNQGQAARPMYQAVCADCSKGCEVPFKPTGDRPVYCKECFAERKANRAQKNAGGQNASPHPTVKTPPVQPKGPVPPARPKVDFDEPPAASKRKAKKKKIQPKKKKK